MILRCQRILFSSYRRDQYDDPESYMASLGMVFEGYSDEVICYVTSPRTGVQRKVKFPPTISEVVEACDDHTAYLANMERFKNWGNGNANLLEPPRENRPTLAQMKEKYGPNWGIGPNDREAAAALQVKEEQNEAAKQGAQARVKAEYENAGLEPPKDLRFSLSLTARKAMADTEQERRGLLPVDHHEPAQ